jgi:threonine dehydrogenase-like Zn-dependent dehydrogenase
MGVSIAVKATLTSDFSELHVFRGHQPSGTDFIMGHEFTGEVVETGSSVKSVQKGDVIVTPFTVNCGECFYCKRGFSSRCAKSQLFGTVGLDGGQAEYARIPLADSTVVKAPKNIEENALVLMADIFPTGYFAAQNAFRGFDEQTIKESTVLLIGCGPVGLCSLVSVLDFQPKHVLAIDGIEARLQVAKKLGAEPWNYQTDMEGLKARIKECTDGRGADTVIELVGHSDALVSPRTVGAPVADSHRCWVLRTCDHGEISVQLVYTTGRFHGLVTKHMARISEYRWADVLSEVSSDSIRETLTDIRQVYSKRHWRHWPGTSTNWISCLRTSYRFLRPSSTTTCSIT